MLRRKQGAERESIRKEVGSLWIIRSKKTSLNKWHLNKDLKNEKEPNRGKGSGENGILNKGKEKIANA